MSKPALGRGLASLLQEESDRGAVKAPGLTPLKAVEPTQSPVQPGPSPSAAPVEAAPALVTPSVVVPAALSPGPTSEGSASVPRDGSCPTAVPSPVPVEMPQVVAMAPLTAAVSGSPPQPLAVPSPVAIPAWMVPALIAGDALVVLSAILWASWGRGWGRWPWIAALFAVGCMQAIVALLLGRLGSNSGAGVFSGRPPGGPGATPGIRVRFVEEKLQGRRGDRR